MKVEVAPRATLLELKPQQVDIPAGEAREVAWDVTAPATRADPRRGHPCGKSRRVTPLRAPPMPSRPASASCPPCRSRCSRPRWCRWMASSPSMPRRPQTPSRPGRAEDVAAAQAGRAREMGACRRARLVGGLPVQLPGAADQQRPGPARRQAGQTVVANLPTYLDSDGLASYFPPRRAMPTRAATPHGLPAGRHARGCRHQPAFALPDEARAPMERAPIAFVEGRIQRNHWSPRKDLDVRKLAAIEALSRYGKAQAACSAASPLRPTSGPRTR